MKILNMFESGLGHMTVEVQTIGGTHNIACTPFQFLVVSLLLQILNKKKK